MFKVEEAWNIFTKERTKCNNFYFGFTLFDWVSSCLRGWTIWLRVGYLDDCLEKELAPWDLK